MWRRSCSLTRRRRADAKAVEQVLIEHYGGPNGGQLLNKINSIAPSNPIYASSIQRGCAILALASVTLHRMSVRRSMARIAPGLAFSVTCDLGYAVGLVTHQVRRVGDLIWVAEPIFDTEPDVDAVAEIKRWR